MGGGIFLMPKKAPRIPGVSGKKIPGSPPRMVGRHLTGVPGSKPYTMSSSTFREYHRQQVRDVSGRFAGGWGFAWQGLEGINDNIYKLNDKWHRDIDKALKQLAKEMADYMKSHRTWTDHPGVHQDAKDNLQAVVVWHDSERFSIWLGHGKDVYYGIWLEVRWGGRYAIVLPTAQHFGPQLGARIAAVT